MIKEIKMPIIRNKSIVEYNESEKYIKETFGITFIVPVGKDIDKILSVFLGDATISVNSLNILLMASLDTDLTNIQIHRMIEKYFMGSTEMTKSNGEKIGDYNGMVSRGNRNSIVSLSKIQISRQLSIPIENIDSVEKFEMYAKKLLDKIKGN